MRLLLVQSSLGRFETKVFPLGLASLAASVPGHEVRILDLNTVADIEGSIRDMVAAFKPEVMGISLRNVDNQNRSDYQYFYRENFQSDVRLLKRHANVPLVVGGTGFSLFPREIMEENPQIDVGVYLEAEESLPELLDHLGEPDLVKGVYYRAGDEVRFSGARPLGDFDALPGPRRDLVDLNAYAPMDGLGIQTKRGCGMNCSYCVYPFLNGRRVRLRSASRVVDEIEELITVHGTNKFFFADTVFTLPIGHAVQVCEEIIRRKLITEWGAYMDMRQADESFLLLAKRAGCRAFLFSPDGYSDEALRGLNKGLTRRQVEEHIGLFLHHPELNQVQVVYHFMLNAPGESLSGLIRTLVATKRLQLRLRKEKRGDVYLSWIRLEPNTEVYELARAQGDVPAGRSLLPPLGEDVSHLYYRHPRLRMFDAALLGLRKAVSAAKAAGRGRRTG